MFNNMLVTFNFLYKKLPVHVEINFFWERNLKAYSAPRIPSRQGQSAQKLHLQATLERVTIFRSMA